ncbi:MAG: hypothetical protein K0U98_26740 [Deltaproteobacteria bacterium]|nr:hypothetical protein [Deltaproteobacteria bacterium]
MESISSVFGLALFSLLVACAPPASEVPEPEVTKAPEAKLGSDTDESVPLVDLLNAKQPMPGLLSGGQPTTEQLAAAAQAGYRTVITLRGEGELADRDEEREVEELGMVFQALPISGKEALNEANARSLGNLLNDPQAQPILLHCGSGNRVGGLLALKAHFVDGLPPEEALAFGMSSGLTSLEETVRERLGL